jgi:hypothetical protein
MEAFVLGEIASGTISADMRDSHEGWLRIALGSLDQWISLASGPAISGRGLVRRCRMR